MCIAFSFLLEYPNGISQERIGFSQSRKRTSPVAALEPLVVAEEGNGDIGLFAERGSAEK
jgi:hypothetical protein